MPRGFAQDLKFAKIPHEAIHVWIAAYSDKYLQTYEVRPIYAQAAQVSNDSLSECT